MAALAVQQSGIIGLKQWVSLIHSVLEAGKVATCGNVPCNDQSAQNKVADVRLVNFIIDKSRFHQMSSQIRYPDSIDHQISHQESIEITIFHGKSFQLGMEGVGVLKTRSCWIFVGPWR